MPTPVSSTSTRTVVPDRVRAQHDRGRCCVCFAAFSPRLRSACSSRSRLTIAHELRRALDLDRRRRRADGASSATSCSSARSGTGSSARPLLAGVRAGERQQRAREAREPRGLALDVGEEAVALDGIVLRARLQHLDGADDRRQRRAQLVRRVRDELALGELAPLLLGQVVEHDQHRVALGLRGDADERERVLLVGVTCACASDAAGSKSAGGEVAQREAEPRLGQRVALGEPAAEHAPRLRVREVHDEVARRP